MTERYEIYKCEICGNIVEVLHDGAGALVCCGQQMKKFEEKTEDQGKEKHVPVIETAEGQVTVKIGSVPHPMEEKHHIEWVEVMTEGGVMRRFLNPGEAPEALFQIGKPQAAREYCNIHGLWSTK